MFGPSSPVKPRPRIVGYYIETTLKLQEDPGIEFGAAGAYNSPHAPHWPKGISLDRRNRSLVRPPLEASRRSNLFPEALSLDRPQRDPLLYGEQRLLCRELCSAAASQREGLVP